MGFSLISLGWIVRWETWAFPALAFVALVTIPGYLSAQASLDSKSSDQNEAPCGAEKIDRWRQGAEHGSSTDQNSLGDLYAKGQCVGRDYVEAAKWYRKSARQGNADAQFNLAMMYSEGLDVPHDYAKAAKWFSKAAEQGHSRAQYALGSLYSTGRGVAKNQVQAYKWIRLSAPREDEHTQAVLEVLSRSMSREQVQEAKAQAQAWAEAHGKSTRPSH